MSQIDGKEIEVCPACRAIYFEVDWMTHRAWHEGEKDPAKNRASRWFIRAKEAETSNDRVRNLHREVISESPLDKGRWICAHCHEWYPCETIQALDGKQI